MGILMSGGVASEVIDIKNGRLGTDDNVKTLACSTIEGTFKTMTLNNAVNRRKFLISSIYHESQADDLYDLYSRVSYVIEGESRVYLPYHYVADIGYEVQLDNVNLEIPYGKSVTIYITGYCSTDNSVKSTYVRYFRVTGDTWLGGA